MTEQNRFPVEKPLAIDTEVSAIEPKKGTALLNPNCRRKSWNSSDSTAWSWQGNSGSLT